MSSEHTAYYRARAAEERLRAANATGSVAIIHQQLAEKYEALVQDGDLEDLPQPGWSGFGIAQPG